MAKLTPVSPVYISSILGIFLLFLLKLGSKGINRIKKINLYLLVFIVYLLLTQFVIGADIHTFANVLISFFIFIVLLHLGILMRVEDIKRAMHFFIKFSILLLSAEAIWRLTHPQWVLDNGVLITEEDISIYPFKVSSFMFQDSNFVGTYSATMFFFCNYLKDVSRRRIRFYKVMFGVLSVLTMSRAAILGILLVVLIRYFFKKMKTNFLFIIGIGLPFFILFLIYLFQVVANDDSFLSKFFILEQALAYWKSADWNHCLFGVGFANAKYYLGIGSHNLLVTYLVDAGIIGLLLMVGFQIYYLIQTKGQGWDVILVFFIIGMSLAGHGVPFYYAQLATIMLCSLKSCNNESKISIQ